MLRRRSIASADISSFSKASANLPALDTIWMSEDKCDEEEKGVWPCMCVCVCVCGHVQQTLRCWKISVMIFQLTLWLKGWHSSPSTPLGMHILRPLSHRLTAQQRPKPHCMSLSQACRTKRRKGWSAERKKGEILNQCSFNPSECLIYIYSKL